MLKRNYNKGSYILKIILKHLLLISVIELMLHNLYDTFDLYTIRDLWNSYKGFSFGLFYLTEN